MEWKRMISVVGAVSLAIITAIGFCGARTAVEMAAEEVTNSTDSFQLQILATSDMHGKFMPYDYALNAESTSGSAAQVASAVRELRTDNTLVLDAGDIFQDNSAELFLEDDIHPMSIVLNAIGYDAWTTGNHEYNYGMETLEKLIGQVDAPLILGNVYDQDGNALGEAYRMFEVNGVKIAVIGMVTPNITRWDSVNLADCTVTDPAEEIEKAIAEIGDEADVLIGLMHMSVNDEYNVPNSGVSDLAEQFPEFDLLIASHGHQGIPELEINGVPIVENRNGGATMAQIQMDLTKDASGSWTVGDTSTELISISDYKADAELTEELESYNARAIENAEVVIGEMVSDYLAAPNEIKEIPTAQIEDTALMDLINEVMRYYADARVSGVALFVQDANLYKGDIRRSDMARIYKYANTLYKLEMTGAQLKKWMEWSAEYYNTFHRGDLTVSFNENVPAYLYDMFSGVNYEINIANEPGNRIENLTWPDGSPVEEDEVFTVAANDYRANSQLTAYGSVFAEGEELPKILEIDMKGELGGIRELIADYIVNVRNGSLEQEADDNWKLTGVEWDEDLHAQVVEMLSDGELEIPVSEDGRAANIQSITVDDLS